MNLVTESWIPVVRQNGKPDTASLMQVFTEGKQFSDLAVRPHERIALMRLLVCIAQAALKGPEDPEAWDNAPNALPQAAKNYLEEWEPSFNLFDSDKPFLQIADVEKPLKEKPVKNPALETISSSKRGRKKVAEENTDDEQTSSLVRVSKLDFALATGANTTLFDHLGSPNVDRDFSTASLAIWLLTFQNFSPGGTIGVALWKKKPTPGWSAYPKIKPGQSSHAPCLPKNMLHAFIRRENLFDTILANLLTKEAAVEHFGKNAWGHPIWEKFPTSIDDSDAIKNATQTYLGRLVPLTRCIKLNQDGKEMLLANGLKYPVFDEDAQERFPAEPSATVIRNHEGTKRLLLGASPGKALWRELSALTIARKNEKDSVGGPLTLRNVPDNEDFDLWVGALLTEKGKPASVLDTVESVLKVQVGMRTDNGRAAYVEEVQWAKSIADKVGRAVETYRKELDGSWEGRLKTAKDKNKLRGQLHAAATRHYWTAVEKLRPLLIAHVEAKGMPLQTQEQVKTAAKTSEETQAAWHKAVHGAARQAYVLACGQETPRQIRAFALGWGKLFAKQPANDAQEPETVETED